MRDLFDQGGPSLYLFGFLVLLCAVVPVVLLGTRAMRSLLRQVAGSAGWTDLRSVLLTANGVKGTWRQLPARFVYVRGSEITPAALVLTINARSPASLCIKPRHAAFVSVRGLELSGPATPVELPAVASQYWMWGDRSIAEHVFADPKIASLIDQNLMDQHDEVVIYPRGVRLTRSIPSFGAIRKHTLAAKYGPIAQTLMALAEGLIRLLR
jgi:hypothetical protein